MSYFEDFNELGEPIDEDGNVVEEEDEELQSLRLALATAMEALTGISEEHADSCGYHKGYHCSCAASIAQAAIAKIEEK